MANRASILGSLPPRSVIEKTMHAVVQIVALQRGLFGNMAPAWTGSGTIVDPKGIVLTNCHVANPRAMGMPAPQADLLAIAITERSDEPPALTYLAEPVVLSPELDLAVLRIVSTLDGRPARGLKLPSVPLGDSDALELGDGMAIFGYPGIGGETVTFTAGAVSGFTHQKGISARRAWIKTDATIAGGNSGGTAINKKGELVGIPTQAAAGSGITPVDARPVVDTNRDGRIDQRDTPMAIGGFINGLRPVNLAKPLLVKAGVTKTGKGARSRVPMTPAPPPSARPSPSRRSRQRSSGPRFTNLVFSRRVTKDGRPIAPADILPGGGTRLYASFDFDGMRTGTKWRQTWAVDGKTIVDEEGKWEDGPRGRKSLLIANSRGLPDGEYHLVLSVRGSIIAEGKVQVGRRVDDTDSEISGRVIDAATGRGIADALVIALKPGVRGRDFVRRQSKDQAVTYARTDRRGHFTFPKQLPKGHAYGLVVVARGYRDLVIDGALRVGSNAPEHAQINPIPMHKG
ncbi:MAG: hypothetical protein D6775_12410 [Caldilineae bacterium]|nr:MAG: hypothetical protein D6775_12410 [Caldilineae bacterium]